MKIRVYSMSHSELLMSSTQNERLSWTHFEVMSSLTWCRLNSYQKNYCVHIFWLIFCVWYCVHRFWMIFVVWLHTLLCWCGHHCKYCNTNLINTQKFPLSILQSMLKFKYCSNCSNNAMSPYIFNIHFTWL